MTPWAREKKARVSVRIPEDIHQAVVERCKNRGLPFSDYVRRLIRNELSNCGDAQFNPDALTDARSEEARCFRGEDASSSDAEC